MRSRARVLWDGWSLPFVLPALASLALAYRLYRLRNFYEFLDETDAMVSGWLLAKGESLYGSVFSHHMPLASALAQLVAVFSRDVRATQFRVVPWLAWTMTAWALSRSPWVRGLRGAANVTGISFLVLAGLAAPLVQGQMLLNELFWGLAIVVFFFGFLLPFLFLVEVTARDAALGGITLALAGWGSLISVYPAAACAFLVLAAIVLSPAHRRSLSRCAFAFLGGLLTTTAAFFCWLLVFGNVQGFFSEAILFNTDVYSTFLPEQASIRLLLLSTVRGWSRSLSDALAAGNRAIEPAHLYPLLGVAIAVVLAIGAIRRAIEKPVQTGRLLLFALAFPPLVLSFVLLLKMRDEGHRALPFYVFVLAAISIGLGKLWATGPAWRLGLATIPVFVVFAIPAVQHESFRWSVSDRTRMLGVWGDMAGFIRGRTDPGDRIAAFPTMPLLYLETHRRPATDALYFLPWQGRWEERFYRSFDTVRQMETARPRFVILFPQVIWRLFPWTEYAERIDAFVKGNYRQVEIERFGGRLWKRLEEPLPETASWPRVTSRELAVETLNGIPVADLKGNDEVSRAEILWLHGSGRLSLGAGGLSDQVRVELVLRSGEKEILVPAPLTPEEGASPEQEHLVRWEASVRTRTLCRGRWELSVRALDEPRRRIFESGAGPAIRLE